MFIDEVDFFFNPGISWAGRKGDHFETFLLGD